MLDYQAWAFLLRDRRTGAKVGAALICPEARYASILWRGATRLDRRFAGGTVWQQLERDFAIELPTSSLAPESAVAHALLTSDDPPLAIGYLRRETIEIAHPANVAPALDALLAEIGAET